VLAVLAVPAPGDDRLCVVEQGGRIVTLDAGLLSVFLDVSSLVSTGGERGLLGLAFHPDYATNGRFFINFTNDENDTIVAEYRRSLLDGSVADPAPVQTLLNVPHPFSNHKGGMLEFGADGNLYIALGDGGGGGDPMNNAQNLGSLLGKLLRIDVSTTPYSIPGGNLAGAAPEVWDYGVRNPWRFSFDACNGDLYIGDPGQSSWEEINFEPAGSGNRNYGWRTMEGAHCFSPMNGCSAAGLTLPIVEYPSAQGCAVIGGFVYRGSAIPSLRGAYLYGDFCSGEVRSFRVSGGGATDQALLLSTGLSISSFGRDANNELYVLDAGGGVYRIEAQ